MTFLRRLCRRASCDKGVALIEFALVLPILVLIFFGTVELGRYATLHLKLDKAANAMADFVTQGATATRESLDAFTGTLPQLMRPYSFNGSVIFSSIVLNVPGTPCQDTTVTCITWQYRPVGRDGSRIGSQGGVALMPGNYTVQDRQNVIAVELYYAYEPLLAATATLIPSLAPHTLYKTAIYKPRQPCCLTELH